MSTRTGVEKSTRTAVEPSASSKSALKTALEVDEGLNTANTQKSTSVLVVTDDDCYDEAAEIVNQLMPLLQQPASIEDTAPSSSEVSAIKLCWLLCVFACLRVVSLVRCRVAIGSGSFPVPSAFPLFLFKIMENNLGITGKRLRGNHVLQFQSEAAHFSRGQILILSFYNTLLILALFYCFGRNLENSIEISGVSILRKIYPVLVNYL